MGEHAIDYANVAQKEKLSELQLRVRQLLDQVEQITKEQNYQRVSKLGRLLVRLLLIICRFPISIEKSDSVKPRRAQINECCGGL